MTDLQILGFANTKFILTYWLYCFKSCTGFISASPHEEKEYSLDSGLIALCSYTATRTGELQNSKHQETCKRDCLKMAVLLCLTNENRQCCGRRVWEQEKARQLLFVLWKGSVTGNNGNCDPGNDLPLPSTNPPFSSSHASSFREKLQDIDRQVPDSHFQSLSGT